MLETQTSRLSSKTIQPQTNGAAARWLTVCGWILVASGVLHILPFLISDAGWEGAVSWRKPILFGISTGLTMVSLGWVANLVQSRRRDAWMLRAVAIALLVEVGFISLQQWRGVASHFNTTTHFDSFVDYSITVLISYAALVIVDLTVRTTGHLRCDADMRLAIRSGMWFLAISCGIGFGILFLGQYQLSMDNSPETFGGKGVLKFPHGIAIHAIQFWPITVFCLKRIGVPLPKRFRVIGWCTGSMATFLVFALFQTFSGRDRFDLTLGSTVLLVAAAAQFLPLAIAVITHANFGRRH